MLKGTSREIAGFLFFVTPATVLFDHLRFSAYVVMIREWGRGRLTRLEIQINFILLQYGTSRISKNKTHSLD
jgi:hypothetical protein